MTIDEIELSERDNYFENIEQYAKTAQSTKDRKMKDVMMNNILASAKEYLETYRVNQ